MTEEKALHLLIVEHESGGVAQRVPNLSVVSLTDLRPVDIRLLQAAATYPSLYRTPHSGAVASYFAHRFAASLVVQRATYDITVRASPESDPVLEMECAEADYVIHALGMTPSGRAADKELMEYIKYVCSRVQKATEAKTSTAKASTATVAQALKRVGHVDETHVEWNAFRAFWVDNSPSQILVLSDNMLVDYLVPPGSFWIDVTGEFDLAGQPRTVCKIQLPVFHAFLSENQTGYYADYDGVSEPEFQSRWMELLRFDIRKLDDMKSDDINPPASDMNWVAMDDSFICHDVFTTLNVYFDAAKHACPAVGTAWVGIRQHPLACVPARPKRQRMESADVIVYFWVRSDGVYAARRPRSRDGVRIGALADWPLMNILVVSQLYRRLPVKVP
jgi:hypothetical protein